MRYQSLRDASWSAERMGPTIPGWINGGDDERVGGARNRRSSTRRPSNAENSSSPEDSFTRRRRDCLTVAECALPGAGIWPALCAVDVTSDCHAAAIHERAVLRSARLV
jgi:hypothetical protein